MNKSLKLQLLNLADNNHYMEIGRMAVEDALIELRDSRIALLGRGNGLVVREKDGRDSHIIRMGMEHALTIALKAIVKHEKQVKG